MQNYLSFLWHDCLPLSFLLTAFFLFQYILFWGNSTHTMFLEEGVPAVHDIFKLHPWLCYLFYVISICEAVRVILAVIYFGHNFIHMYFEQEWWEHTPLPNTCVDFCTKRWEENIKMLFATMPCQVKCYGAYKRWRYLRLSRDREKGKKLQRQNVRQNSTKNAPQKPSW